AALVENYRGVGVRLFVLAYAVPDAAYLAHLERTLGMPVKVVRLTVSLADITRRLQSDVTTGRQDDLREAAAWLATSQGAGIEGLTMANDRPIREVAAAILDWMGVAGAAIHQGNQRRCRPPLVQATSTYARRHLQRLTDSVPQCCRHRA